MEGTGMSRSQIRTPGSTVSGVEIGFRDHVRVGAPPIITLAIGTLCM
jgi:hypothetical protein